MFNGDLSLFQFHKGTIKAPPAAQMARAAAAFQFHKGTIKAMRFRNIVYYVAISIP